MRKCHWVKRGWFRTANIQITCVGGRQIALGCQAVHFAQMVERRQHPHLDVVLSICERSGGCKWGGVFVTAVYLVETRSPFFFLVRNG
jgi:hypothetical protein